MPAIFCLCRCWLPFCSQRWVLWVLVTQWSFPLWPLTMGLAVWWRENCGILPFQTGETLTPVLFEISSYNYSTSIVEYLAVAVQLLNRKKYIYFTFSMSTVSNTVVQRSALSPQSRKVVGTIPWPCSLSMWSLHALCFLLLSKDMSCDMLLRYTSRPWVQEEQWWNKCESV